jgi:uncharacterized protein YukE
MSDYDQSQESFMREESARLEQLRDILFGRDKTDINERFQQTQQQFEQDIQVLRDELHEKYHAAMLDINNIHEELQQRKETMRDIADLLDQITAALRNE